MTREAFTALWVLAVVLIVAGGAAFLSGALAIALILASAGATIGYLTIDANRRRYDEAMREARRKRGN